MSVMAYRGEDLDLRTPQSWNPPPPDTAPLEPYASRSRSRAPQPILVDDIVLACCNHAFDVAVAHRASEVRLEHLLHAMTRIDGASNALETRGIRVSGLRRESATIIAGEIPIGVSAGQTRPRRSDDLETVLRQASSIAYRRNGPANIDDVLDALFDMPPDLPGIALLARHGGRIARDRGRSRTVREPLPLPPLTRAASSFDDLRTTEPPRAGALRSDAIGTSVDGIQNARLDQIENAVRALTSEVLAERKTLAGLVQDLHRNVSAERDDAKSFRGGLHDRMQNLEQAVLTTGKSQDADDLIDRLAAIERSLDGRLADLSRPWGVLSERLQALEQTVLDSARGEPEDFSGLHDRLGGLERAVREIKDLKPLDFGPVTSRLDIIEEAVLSPDTAMSNDAITSLGGRIKALEEALESHRSNATNIAQALTGEIRSLSSAIATHAANTEHTHSLVSDRVQALASGLEHTQSLVTDAFARNQSDAANTIQGLINAASDRQQADILAFDRRRTEADSAAQERLSALEAKLGESIQQNGEAQAAHNAELKEVHDALIKLNTNQHTLAGSIDQWRLDGVGDISVISKQLETIQASTAKPLQMIEALTTNVDNINRVTIERLHRRNRFWYWLFGTDDWLTASWPSQVASVERDQTSLRSNLTGSNRTAQR